MADLYKWENLIVEIHILSSTFSLTAALPFQKEELVQVFWVYVAELIQKFIIILLVFESYLNTGFEFSTVCSSPYSEGNMSEKLHLRLRSFVLKLSSPILWNKFNVVYLVTTGHPIAKVCTKRSDESGRHGLVYLVSWIL